MTDSFQPRVICIGESMAQITPPLGESLTTSATATIQIAGAESNVALYLADFGHHVAWLSRVGEDPFGDRILNALRGTGVDTRFVLRDSGRPTGVYFKDHGEDGTRIYYYRSDSAAAGLAPEDLDGIDFDRTDLLHVSGITPALSASAAQTSAEAFRRARSSGVTSSFDVNYRPQLWPPSVAAPVLLESARQADIVFVGLDEATLVWGTRTGRDIRNLLGSGPILVVKDAAVGATAFEDDRETFVPAETVEVVEPVGAGDAFAAGFLSGQLRGSPIEEKLWLGHQAAGFALSSVGDHADAKSLRNAVMPLTRNRS